MLETLKFIKVETCPLDRADTEIGKYEYQKTMDGLYGVLDKYKSLGFDAAKTNIGRHARDRNVKNIIGEIKNTHTILGYVEIISDTDKPNVKKISIVVGGNGKESNSEDHIILLKDKLHKAYESYNKIISDGKYEEPFLEWDGEVLFDKKQIKTDIQSINGLGDGISQQTGVDLKLISKLIDITLQKKGL